MNKTPVTAVEDSQDEIAALIRTLHETQQRLQQLAGGEVDAVIHVDGQSYLLHEAQEKLRRSEAAQHDLATTQSAILNSLPAHIALLDNAGKIISVNDGWRNFAANNTSDSSSSWVGQNYLECCEKAQGEFAEEAQRAAAGIRSIVAGEAREFSMEYPCHSPDQQRWFQLTVTPLQNEGAQGAVVMHLDITQRKRFEQQILRSQRMESVGTLAAGIAHDLNNALTPIVMSIALLKQRFPDHASRDLLNSIDTSAHRGADMVRQLLSFVRGVEGKRVEVQLEHLVKNIEKLANDTFLKNIEVHTVLPRDLWTVLGDSTQLHQVLLNLAVNARDAMPWGGRLTIRAENRVIDLQQTGTNPEMDAGSYVLMQMIDTGTGISPEVIDKIFEPFFTTKEIGKGTGLGLSTTLGIVQSHGGHLRVSSRLGQGSMFEIFLPAHVNSSANTAAADKIELPRGAGELILVIDDEAPLRQVTGHMLETFGYRVVLACDGLEAVTLCAERGKEIAAVITDMAMPNMDGAATIQVLHRLRPGLPIIVTSGLATDAQVAIASKLGVKDFLAKPYTVEALLLTLRKVLS